jgi:hypothetical protein
VTRPPPIHPQPHSPSHTLTVSHTARSAEMEWTVQKAYPKNVVDLVELIHFVGAWEQRPQCRHLEKDATDRPSVHLKAVVTVSEQAFGRAVPARGNVLGERHLQWSANVTMAAKSVVEREQHSAVPWRTSVLQGESPGDTGTPCRHTLHGPTNDRSSIGLSWTWLSR